MTDRTNELADDYRKMMYKLRQEIKKEVEGDWYLFEKEGYEPWIANYAPTHVPYGEDTGKFLREYHAKRGWAATPITIFRKN